MKEKKLGRTALHVLCCTLLCTLLLPLSTQAAGTTPYGWSGSEWLCHHGLGLGLIALLLAVCAVAVLRQRRQRKAYEQSLLLAKERHKMGVKYQKKIFYQANFDALTGLYNKTYFLEKANERMKDTPGEVFTFLRLNVKQLKMINELYGIEAGDKVLCTIADCMREHIGKNGVYGRLYADQFAVCMAVDAESLQQCFELCVQSVEYKGQEIRIDINMGVYVDTKQCRDANLALDYAQIALQNSERVGDEHHFYYEDSLLETMRLNQQITNSMEAALREEQFQIYLQPQFDISAQKLVGAEALVRWMDPVRGMMPPDRFIPVFESNGFIYRLDAYVCDKVCALLARWKEQGKLVPISINLSRVDLDNPDLLAMLQGTLARYDVPIQYLHLEITESTYAKHREDAFLTIQRLQDVGFCLEMDDFGSGYSSLNMLKDIPVDILKLDMKFFDGERHMDRGGSIVEGVVKLAHSLGVIVVAEGVETEREANFLRSISCSIVQGYRYGRPEPMEAFEARLAASEVGAKRIHVRRDDSGSGLYWGVEKYNLLLRSEGIIVFDYDPFQDRAVISGPGQQESVSYIADCTKRTLESSHIHPDSRAALLTCLTSRPPDPAEVDFQARWDNKGDYIWFHAVFHYYESGNMLSRVIAMVKPKK